MIIKTELMIILIALENAKKDGVFDFTRLGWLPAKIEHVMLCHEAWYHDVVRMDVDQFAEVLRTGDPEIIPLDKQVTPVPEPLPVSEIG